VIICTKDRPDNRSRAISSVRAFDQPGVRHVHLPSEGRGFGHTRYVGVREAQRGSLTFVVDDCGPAAMTAGRLARSARFRAVCL
jgi:hypothetical protein